MLKEIKAILEKKTIIIFLLFLISSFSNCQIKYPFNSFNEFKIKLYSFCSIKDKVQRNNLINALCDTLKQHHKIPFTYGDSVAFLYRGNAALVKWAGDFNNWDPANDSFTGFRIDSGKILICIKSFPINARLDYKIIADGNWITDPDNSFFQYSGMGSTNSVLIMPEWVYPKETISIPAVPKGNMSKYFSIASVNLSYTVYYRIYTPFDYENMSNIPVIYLTDGNEYSDDRLGCMTAVLDNLIYEKKIKPVIAVFIDSRSSPDSLGINRRISEYSMNKKYADFVCDELVSFIDANYKTNKSPDWKAILGASLGGINSAFTGYYRNDTFHLIGINSPAFWYKPEIFDDFEKSINFPIKVFISTGTIYDSQLEAKKMKDIFDKKGYSNLYIEVPEGHSWGNWRSRLKDLLIYFFKE